MTYKFLDLTGLKQTITQIFSKLKAVALSGSYTDLINKPTIVNNGTTTTTNTVLDGRMGKTLADKDANLQSQITSLNSSLADMRKEYLKRYYYQSANAETWKAFNIALPASISNYGYIPLLAILGTNIYILNITSQAIGSSLTDDGVLFNKLLGSTEIYITAVKEGSDNHVRIKFTIMNEAVNLPVSIYSLREGVTIDSAWFSQS